MVAGLTPVPIAVATFSLSMPAENDTITSPSWPLICSASGIAVASLSRRADASTWSGGPDRYIGSSGIQPLWLRTTRVLVSLMPNWRPRAAAKSRSSPMSSTPRSNWRSLSNASRSSWT